MFLGIYTGTLSCIVKLPNEVCASHTKSLGENKSFYNLRSSQKCCSLFNPFNRLFQNKKSRREKKYLPRKKSWLEKKIEPKKRVEPEKTNIVKKKLDDKN